LGASGNQGYRGMKKNLKQSWKGRQGMCRKPYQTMHFLSSGGTLRDGVKHGIHSVDMRGKIKITNGSCGSGMPVI
jgi:hypothetical protein